MALKIKPLSISKRELESTIIANPDAVEQGFRILARQHPTDGGPIDLLGVDAEATLVVLELKTEAVDGHLDQGLRYYDWCTHNLARITHGYNSQIWVNPAAPPRLILIAPSFTDMVKRLARHIDIELQLFAYQAFENEKTANTVIFTEIDLGQPPEPPPILTREKELEYLRDAQVKDLFKAVLSPLQHVTTWSTLKRKPARAD